ncbi:TetR/AcrR family transcriptional regulator [Nocardia salmonicida]|uniref:TetR/AcrR family transcriptional regulator n=1 Tax=Nocardia salmonicida TaxID=53431 RepID=UPI00368A0893
MRRELCQGRQEFASSGVEARTCHDGLMAASNESNDRPYAGVTAAERRRTRQGRLASAVLDIVHEKGIESLGVSVVCERASVSKRHFYETYENLDALSGETLADALAEVRVTIAAHQDDRDDTDDGAALLRRAVNAILATFDDPRMAKLYLEAPGNRGLRNARDTAVTEFVDQLLRSLGGDHGTDPQARLIAQLLVVGTTEVVAMWLRGDLDLTREQVVATLVTLGTDAIRRIRTQAYDAASDQGRVPMRGVTG